MRKKPAAKPIDRKAAMLVAGEFILFEYPNMFAAGLPRRLKFTQMDVWIVPIVLTHPAAGVLGQAGFVAVEVATGRVVGSTPRAEVIATGKQLRESQGHGLEAAVFSSRAL